MAEDVEEIRESQRPDAPAGPEPEITPDMIHSVFAVLDSRGLLHHTKGGAYIPTEGGWKLLRGTLFGKETINAYGHESIVARDEDCFEITTNVEPRGEDNIIAVRADKGCKALSVEFKNAAKSANKMIIRIEAGEAVEEIIAFGSPALKLTDVNEVVVRKSDYIDGKTVAILADKSANEFGDYVKEKLKDPNTKVRITLEVK